MKAFRSISAVLLALLVLVSSTSFMVGMHFCQGEIQNIALFSKADGCEKEMSLPPCHRHQQMPCCADKTVVHDGDDFKASIEHLYVVAPMPVAIAQALIQRSEIIPTAPFARAEYYNYDPPLRSWDLTVQYQVFLI
jgi:hypothetical protein